MKYVYESASISCLLATVFKDTGFTDVIYVDPVKPKERSAETEAVLRTGGSRSEGLDSPPTGPPSLAGASLCCCLRGAGSALRTRTSEGLTLLSVLAQ